MSRKTDTRDACEACSRDLHHKFPIALASYIGDMLRGPCAVSTLALDLKKTANPSKGGDAKPPV